MHACGDARARTFVALNTHGTPTAAFVKNPDWAVPGRALRGGDCQAVGPSACARSTPIAGGQALGDSIYTNPLMLGYAWQQGRIPLTLAALMRAIELNGVQVENNKAAFEWGRRLARRPVRRASAGHGGAGDRVRAQADARRAVSQAACEFLTALPERAYAARYRTFVDKVRAAERRWAGTS